MAILINGNDQDIRTLLRRNFYKLQAGYNVLIAMGQVALPLFLLLTKNYIAC